MMRRREHKRAAVAIASGLLINLAVPVTAHSAWVFEPSATLRTGYDDNFRMAPDEEDAIPTSGSVQGRIVNASDTHKLNLLGGIGVTKYSGTDDDLRDESREEFFFNIDGLRSFEKGAISFEADFRRQDLIRRVGVVDDDFGVQDGGDLDLGDESTLEDDLIEGTEADFAASDALVSRDRISVEPSFTYDLGPRLGATAFVSYSEQEFESGAVGDFQDSETTDYGASLNYSLSERDNISFQVLRSEFDPDDSEESETNSATIGWQRQMSERLLLDLSAGGRETKSNGNSETGVVLRAFVDYRIEAGRLFAILERSYTPNAFGQVVETDGVRLGVRRRMSPRLSWSVVARVVSTDEETSENQLDRSQDLIRVSPSVRWRFTESLAGSLAYTYTWVDRDRNPESVSSNAVSFSLTYSPPKRIQ